MYGMKPRKLAAPNNICPVSILSKAQLENEWNLLQHEKFVPIQVRSTQGPSTSQWKQTRFQGLGKLCKVEQRQQKLGPTLELSSQRPEMVKNSAIQLPKKQKKLYLSYNQDGNAKNEDHDQKDGVKAGKV